MTTQCCDLLLVKKRGHRVDQPRQLTVRLDPTEVILGLQQDTGHPPRGYATILPCDMLTSTADDLIRINEGAIAEQFVAQELLAYRDCTVTPSLFYWAREARNSSAEVDYLVPCGSHALPIEVKAGKTGTLRSMHLYLNTYHLPIGVRVSQLNINKSQPVVSIPFYAIQRIDALARELF